MFIVRNIPKVLQLKAKNNQRKAGSYAQVDKATKESTKEDDDTAWSQNSHLSQLSQLSTHVNSCQRMSIHVNSLMSKCNSLSDTVKQQQVLLSQQQTNQNELMKVMLSFIKNTREQSKEIKQLTKLLQVILPNLATQVSVNDSMMEGIDTT